MAPNPQVSHSLLLPASNGFGCAAPSNVRERLSRLPGDIRVAITGAGAMGKGLFYQCHITPGISCVVIADLKLERAIDSVKMTGREYRVVSTRDELHHAIRSGYVAVCEDGDLAARCELADVLIESTSSIIEAAAFSLTALRHQKHLILMNAEIDLIFGPYLMQVARENGVVYSSCDGDQHGVIAQLIHELELWGFDLVMAGNMKGFLDRYATPTSIVYEADKRNLDYRMCTAYTDGTKLCIEMALLANAFNLSTAVPGMIGPRAENVRDVHTKFDLDAIYQTHGPTVDYILGAQPDGGVYAVGYGDNPYQRQMMAYYKMGPGPYYVFYRPYHLCHVEAMKYVALAYLDGISLLEPTQGFRTNVYTYAKADLRAGALLEGIGGHTCYGMIENCQDNEASPGLPICLAESVRLTRDIPKDGKILMSDIANDAHRLDFRLFEESLSATSTASIVPHQVCEVL